MYSLQCKVYSVQFKVYSVQCTSLCTVLKIIYTHCLVHVFFLSYNEFKLSKFHQNTKMEADLKFVPKNTT